MTGPGRQFRFAQFEFPWVLGPDDGRYMLRDAGADSPSHVLVLATLGAQERRRFGGRKPRTAPAEPGPTAVATTRATVIDADAVPEAEATTWLDQMTGDEPALALDEAVAVLNGALRAHRVAARDAGINDVTRDQAIVARLGHGDGDAVADGRWSAAIEVPPDRGRRERRTAAMRPQERLAALLAGREAPLACEELSLRARLDLDAGRGREAALQLRVALEAAIAELARSAEPAAVSQRVGELREQRHAVGDAANAALEGELDEARVAAVEEALGRVEAALRARGASRGADAS